ncbi:hypothetical protein EBZ38_03145 [bacterium]|nr:hypothetical protein [bacterium]
MNEQQYINLFFVPLNYYIGYYYTSRGEHQKAIQKYTKCIEWSPYFSHPYLQMANYYIKSEDLYKATEYLEKIHCKRTLDMTSGNQKRVANLSEHNQITRMLGGIYMQCRDYTNAERVYKRAKRFLEDNASDYSLPVFVSGFADICLALGEVYGETDPITSFKYYSLGMSKVGNAGSGAATEFRVQKRMLLGLCMSVHYTDMVEQGTSLILKYAPLVYKQFTLPQFPDPPNSCDRVRIGYLSPDFNKNAVGLFVTHFLKHFDKDRFEVYVYYTNKSEDVYTEQFKSYPGVIWTNLSQVDDSIAYNIIKFKHRIDVLVDLISAGMGGRLELISMSPAKYMINYLGYPGTSGIPQMGYRLADKITDPPEKDAQRLYSEKLVYLSRNYVNFHLFDNVTLPPIEDIQQDVLHISVMNKTRKHHPKFRELLKDILIRLPNAVLFLKCDENEMGNLPKLYDWGQGRIRFLPFRGTLESYLCQFNNICVSIDTFPYSGTTTTCTSLLMGVPVLTVYDPKNPHVSNVSASILKNCGLDEFVYSNTEELTNALCNWKHVNKEEIRFKFLRANDPIRFMRDYENVILKLHNNGQQTDTPLGEVLVEEQIDKPTESTPPTVLTDTPRVTTTLSVSDIKLI